MVWLGAAWEYKPQAAGTYLRHVYAMEFAGGTTKCAWKAPMAEQAVAWVAALLVAVLEVQLVVLVVES